MGADGDSMKRAVDILAIDDTTENLKLLDSILGKAGYRVHSARGAEPALRYLEEGKPDLILLDMRMPDIDGIETCRRIKGLPAHREVPVIFVSAADATEDKVKAFRAGAVDYLTRPISAEELLARVGTHLALRDLNQRLGERVRERTAELEKVTRHLEEELAERKRAEEALRVSEERYRVVFEHSALGKTLTSPDGRLIDLNKAFAAMLGYTVEELRGRDFHALTYPDDQGLSDGAVRLLLQGRSSHQSFEKRYVHRDGHLVWVEIDTTLLRDGQGAPRYFITSASNITEKREAAEALRRNEGRLRGILRTAMDGFWRTNQEGRILEVNEAYCRMSGYAESELLSMRVSDLEARESADDVAGHLAKILEAGEDRFETSHRCRDGRLIDLEVSVQAQPTEGEQISFLRDISERKAKDRELRTSLAEKETLLRELYHRTKNNMGVINALLGLSAEGSDDEGLRVLLDEMQGRIKSMALVHQMLYESQDLSKVSLDDYIKRLVEAVMGSYRIGADRVGISTELMEVSVLIDTAIPCGLILNELLANALKYAFPGERRGTIRIKLARDPEGAIALEVSDDGIGFPRDFDPRRDGKIGMQTVLGLAEIQLRAQTSYRGDGGTTFSMRFTDDLYSTRI